MNIVLLATAWGPKFGGINAFNQDFAAGLAQELGSEGQVFCATVGPTEAEIADAQQKGVALIPILGKRGKGDFDTSWVYDATSWIGKQSKATIDWWVGHDLITGAAALRAPTIGGGRAALIHHMSYAAYQSVKHDSSAEADEKHQQQRDLFRNGGALFAVGPLLRRSCQELSGTRAQMLVPGFPSGTKSSCSPDDRLVAVTFGRLEQESDRIKQGRLAAAGFGHALKLATQSAAVAGIEVKTLRQARLYMIGVSAEAREEEAEVKRLVDEHAQRMANVHALPFDSDREMLFQRLSEANLAMMLSWHEGFGLTGWEAIAAEMPLIVGKESGLYQLLDTTLQGAGTGCVSVVDVQGRRGAGDDLNFTQVDLESVARAILRIAHDLPHYKKNAKNLRELLVSRIGCTWRHTARQFLDVLSASEAPEASSPVNASSTSGAPDQISTAPAHSRKRQFVAEEILNSVPGCAELIPGTTPQGSSPMSFGLLPEVRFSCEEFEVDGLAVTYGISEATLKVDLEECHIAQGERLGDSREKHPNIVAKGGNSWEIRGPKESGILQRRALGTEELCRVRADAGANARVSFVLGCRRRHIVYEFIEDEPAGMPVTKARILGVFLSKCLDAGGASESGSITLSRAIMVVKDELG